MSHHLESLRPVVLLDFDGVLNPHGMDAHLDGYREHHIHVPVAHVPDSPFVAGFGRTDLDVTVRIHPTHGAWVRSLTQVADVMWATTWEHAANTHLAPLLGIDPLPVAVSVNTHPPRFAEARNGDASSWKANAILSAFPGRPLVWVDDLAGSYARASEHVEKTQHYLRSRDQRFLTAARKHRWDDRETFPPSAHFEDTWAAGGWLTRSGWSTLGTGTNSYRHAPAGTMAQPAKPAEPAHPWLVEDEEPSWMADPSPTLILAPVPEIGITPADMHTITTWLHTTRH